MRKLTAPSIIGIPTTLLLALVLSACSLIDDNSGTVSTQEMIADNSIIPVVETMDISAETAQSTPVLESEPATLAPASDLESSLIQVYQHANPSVVYIITPSGSGSGFVYSQEGHIVTNNHVVSGAQSFEVVFASQERQQAELVGSDPDSDLAIIQVPELPEGVTPLPLAQPDDLVVGQFVLAIGNPFGAQGSMTLGIVSALGRSLPSQRELSTGSTYSLSEVIQTDAPINPGNSGGPLLNLEGQVVGVNAAIASQTNANSGVGFSIPVKAVHRIVPQLIQTGQYRYPYIGAGFDGEISLEELALYGLPRTQGAYVISVTAGGPADQAGVTAANPNTGRGGDLVIAIDGQPVDDFSDLNSYLIFSTIPGQTIELMVLREGQEVSLPLTLGTRP